MSSIGPVFEDHDRVNELWAPGGPFRDDIDELVETFPTRRGLVLDWDRLEAFDRQLSNAILNFHDDARTELTEAFRAQHGEKFGDDDAPDVFVRLASLPNGRTFRVGKQRTHHLGDLIALEGRVVHCGAVDALARRAAFRCPNRHLEYAAQSFGRLMYPPRCEAPECDKSYRKSHWRFDREHSHIVDYRRIVIEPIESNLEEPPEQFCALTNDLVDLVGPDDHITVVGKYDTANFQNTPDLDTYLHVWGVDNDGAGETDRLSPGELRDKIEEKVTEMQNAGSGFGAPRADVVEAVRESAVGIREQEVEDSIDDMLSEDVLSDAGDDRLFQ